MSIAFHLRQGRPDDADTLAQLVNYAGEGLPYYLWQKIAAAGQSPWEIGRQRAQRDQGSFSYRNATIAEVEAKPIGCLIGYAIAAEPDPVPADLPAMFVPLQELENLAPNTWYVNVLAVMPPCRNRGIGSSLLRHAAKMNPGPGLSVIVSNANVGARRLYERLGYRERSRRPMVKDGWAHDGDEWVLLCTS
jgi:ribosomal protein S18 acetylase RimI-like enzyme